MATTVEPYIDQWRLMLSTFPSDEVNQMTDKMEAAYHNDATVFVIGNGGSASTASHFAADVNKNVVMSGRRPRVLALTDNVEAVTAWGNDTEYANVYVEQLKNFYRSGDTLVAISGSGSSPNVIRAVEWVKQNSGVVIGMTGQQGDKLRQLSDICVTAPTTIMEQIEDCHVMCMHAMIVSLRHRIASIPQ